MAKFKPYFEISLSDKYSPDERRAIAAEIIDEIIKRTENGIDAEGKSFKGYSKKYAEEKGQNNVDLTFSGSMLSDIELIQSNIGKIRIGYERNYKDLGKVEGNVLGTYGQDKPTKPRNFLGLTKDELNSILKNYPLNDKEERKERVAEVLAVNIVSDDIIRRSGFIDEES